MAARRRWRTRCSLGTKSGVSSIAPLSLPRLSSPLTWIHVFADDSTVSCPSPPLLRAGPSTGGGSPSEYLVYLLAFTNLVASPSALIIPCPSPHHLLVWLSPTSPPPLFVWYRGYHAPTGCASSLSSSSSPLPGLGSCPESTSQGTPVILL
ncbi:hypothetical protein EDB86DRAFT_2922002, partial [Lactarius hatsudake]